METNIVDRGAVSIGEALRSMDEFKRGVNNLLLKRRFFVEKVLPILQENKDYFVVRDRKSLAKGGAEKLASIFGISANFERDDATMSAFADVPGLIAYVCNLTRDGQVLGQGRGSYVLDASKDVNKAIKMAQKSAYIDGIIRTTGLSDTFTQDMAPGEINNPVIQTEEVTPNRPDEPPMITDRQKSYLEQLIYDHVTDEDQREESLSGLQSLTRFDASQMISSFAGAR